MKLQEDEKSGNIIKWKLFISTARRLRLHPVLRLYPHLYGSFFSLSSILFYSFTFFPQKTLLIVNLWREKREFGIYICISFFFSLYNLIFYLYFSYIFTMHLNICSKLGCNLLRYCNSKTPKFLWVHETIVQSFTQFKILIFTWWIRNIFLVRDPLLFYKTGIKINYFE